MGQYTAKSFIGIELDIVRVALEYDAYYYNGSRIINSEILGVG